MLTLYYKMSHSQSAFIFSYVMPAVMVLAGCLIVFGITLVWSLRIFKIRNVSFLKIVSAGFISFCGSWVLCALLIAIFNELKYYFPSLMYFSVSVESHIYLILTAAMFFVFHLLIDFLLAVYYLKIPQRRAILPSIMTEIFNMLLLFFIIVVFAGMITGFPFTYGYEGLVL